MSLRYIHVDVFATRPYSGNSLAVFPDGSGLTAGQMATITRELRHFESIFLTPEAAEGCHRARVFDLLEELDFAGHPVIGAACALHAGSGGDGTRGRWTLRLNARTVTVETTRLRPGTFAAVLDQGPAEFLGVAPAPDRTDIAAWFSLAAADLHPALAPEVVSTGLRYLVLPVRPGALDRARIAVADLERRLAALGAQFAYLLDVEGMEGRHWNNDGVVEDVATGSGAGCVAAYLRRHGLTGDGEMAVLHQGRHLGRPSQITLRAHGGGTRIRSVEVGGAVSIVGQGLLDVLPEVA